MWAYWLLFLVPAGIHFSPIRVDKNVNYVLMAIVGLLGILLIGLRYEVGGDWDNYFVYLEIARNYKDGLVKILSVGNANALGYMVLNWLVVQLNLGVQYEMYVVNFICAAIFMVGLTKYCQKQPFPWMALAVAMPYMVCCVAMGYTRQATALGFFLWGLSFLRAGKELKFIGLILLGSTFHLSLIVTMPIVVFAREKIHWLYYPFFVVFVVGAYSLFQSLGVYENYESIYRYTMQLYSAGGTIRAYMNILPVIVSLFFWKRIKRISPDYRIIKWLSIAAFICIPLLSLSTTMVDRFALYLMVLQVAIWPRVVAVQRTMLNRTIWSSIIIGYYGLVLFVWFNFAVHAYAWLPYRMWPFTHELMYPPPVPMGF